MSSSLTIVLADDHAVVRAGLRALLERSMTCTLVGEVCNGPEELDLVERLQPTLLVVDLMMPVGSRSLVRCVRPPRRRGLLFSPCMPMSPTCVKHSVSE